MSCWRLTVTVSTRQVVQTRPVQHPLQVATTEPGLQVATGVQQLAVRQTVQHPLTLTTGPPGPQGPQGPQGEPGDVDGYLHEQTSPAATWIVEHNLGRLPVVSLIADSGEQVEADVHYPSTDTVTVVFAQAATGKAALI